jgi:hypothetical protein
VTPEERDQQKGKTRRGPKVPPLMVAVLRYSAVRLAQTLVFIALFFWLLLAVLGFTFVGESQVPRLGFLPLYALYPGKSCQIREATTPNSCMSGQPAWLSFFCCWPFAPCNAGTNRPP